MNLIYCSIAYIWRNEIIQTAKATALAVGKAMLDKKAVQEDRSAWPDEIKAEFERESRRPNGCVGTQLLSETDKVRIWIIRLRRLRYCHHSLYSSSSGRIYIYFHAGVPDS